MNLKKVSLGVAGLIAMLCASGARADEVTDWNETTMQVSRVAGLNALVAGRLLAMVHGSIFDAVNGIERKYEPVHVDFNAPPGASRRAAAIEAAYTVLVSQYPAQKTFLDAKRAESLAALPSGGAPESNTSIERGLEWGRSVANDIVVWRSSDGFTPTPPPFTGGTAIGQWRPTPPAFASGLGPQFATMTTWAIPSPSFFAVPAPPALTSAEYAADVNEVKAIGRNTSTTRTREQAEIAGFWFGNTPFYWMPLARSLAVESGNKLSENAHFFALMTISMADSVITCWEAKYRFQYWRPITAIEFADVDGNPATDADATWRPLFNTPSHPEYLSGHSTASGAAAMAMLLYFGDATFTIDSSTIPGAVSGIVRTFTGIQQASMEVGDSRVYGGIHFRTACNVGRATGEAIAQYVLTNALQPNQGNTFGQLNHVHPSLGPALDGGPSLEH